MPVRATSSTANPTIDINTVNLNINELYKQYAKKPLVGSSLQGASHFNNTTQFYKH
jgi:hypothetical protein